MNGKVIIFSAPSGSGKTTIVKHLLSKGLPLEFSVSATSRPPRSGEQNGIDYYFLNPDTFKKKIQSNEFVEWEEVYPDTFYGTLKSETQRIWSHNNHVIFDVDVKGGLSLKKLFPTNSLSVFVMPPSIEELRKRLVHRSTDPANKIEERVQKAAYELTYTGQFDKVLINDQLEKALGEAEKLVSEFIKS